MQGTSEGCILLEQMSEVQKKVAKVEGKQWILIGLVAAMFTVLSLGFFKLLDSQIYMLSGEHGLRVIGDEAHEDIKVFRKVNNK
jgi:hypothetical protein